MEQQILANADILEVEVAIPEGHRHVRTIVRLRDGGEIILQEATVANLVRAFVTVKTDPQKSSCRLVARELPEGQRKKGFAPWQLLEE